MKSNLYLNLLVSMVAEVCRRSLYLRKARELLDVTVDILMVWSTYYFSPCYKGTSQSNLVVLIIKFKGLEPERFVVKSCN